MDLDTKQYPDLDDYDYTGEEKKRVESMTEAPTDENSTPEEEVEV